MMAQSSKCQNSPQSAGLEELLPSSSQIPSVVLEIDQKTPDNHVCRDPRLIRLTGAHPFNAEAPLTALSAEGFITPPELFFVRNHGAVPKVLDEEIPDWEFTVSGLVENSITVTLRELMKQYEQWTYPVTLVCAGNRRKEQNQVRKTNGFSWGPAGVSTALFTGVLMSDVVRRAKPLGKARYVCMEGADNLPNGHYGTCVKLSWVMNSERGIMLAYRMNGEMLMPDHGRPLRAVVPGQIGGRSVKWLKKLILTEAPSKNWYHIYDNKVLPTMISPDAAANDHSLWKDERYTIYDLSPNSAIVSPAHGETLSLAKELELFRARGYAYAGGGRRVTRVEVSIDSGRAWRLAEISYAEDRYRNANGTLYGGNLYGGNLDFGWRETSFCWCLWAIDIPVEELAKAKELIVRCMDEGMCAQPRDMYWNVLGMMNNPWFRVAISTEGDSLRFEHPTQPALIPGGWMEGAKQTNGRLTHGEWHEDITTVSKSTNGLLVKDITLTKEGLDRKIALEELEGYRGAFVVNGEVFDGSMFLDEHPGGAQSIIGAAATDVTEEFLAIHSEIARAMMPKYHIGTLDAMARQALSAGAQGKEQKKEVFLQREMWSAARLHAKVNLSRDTRLLSFKLEHEEQGLGLQTGQHVMVRLRDPVTREAIVRCYTPVSSLERKGYVDLLVKIYFDDPDTGKKGGACSKAIDSLPIGHTVDFKGPIGKFEYHGGGEYSLNGNRKHAKQFLMICGGSGVTPIYQVFRTVMRDQQDPTVCTVLDTNRHDGDILYREHLDTLALEGQGRGRLIYTLTNGSDKWTGMRGRITGRLIHQICPWCEEAVVLVCGPKEMEKDMRACLEDNGWNLKTQVIFF